MNKVILKYAKKLLQFAVEGKILTHVHQEMYYLNQVCAANKILGHTLKNPLVKQEKKLAVLRAIFPNTISTLTHRFLTTVIQKQQGKLIPFIAKAFLDAYNHYKGIKIAKVTTTFPLSDTLMLQLQEIVQRITPCKQVLFDQHVDPGLIGGYILQVEDKRIDQSLRNKLNTLQKHWMRSGDIAS